MPELGMAMQSGCWMFPFGILFSRAEQMVCSETVEILFLKNSQYLGGFKFRISLAH